MHSSRILAALHLPGLILAAIIAKEPEPLRPCGFKIAPCPEGSTCSAHDASCPLTRGENCIGSCVTATTSSKPTKTWLVTKTYEPTVTTTRHYEDCGGERLTAKYCPTGLACVDDPRVEGCGMACDAPGICVDVAARSCAGKMGRRCAEGLECFDMKEDGCDPEEGGVDCGGICL